MWTDPEVARALLRLCAPPETHDPDDDAHDALLDMPGPVAFEEVPWSGLEPVPMP